MNPGPIQLGKSRRRSDAFFGALIALATWNVPAHAGVVLYVDPDAPGVQDGSSWSHAYHELRDALAAALFDSSVAEVRVAEGLYFPTGDVANRGASFVLPARPGFMLKGSYYGYGTVSPNNRFFGVTDSVLCGDLLGNDGDIPFSDCCLGRLNEAGCDQPDCEAEVCAVDASCCPSNRAASGAAWWTDCVALAENLCGDLCTFNNDNSRHIVTAAGTNESVVLEGFVIEHGHASGPSFSDQRGGALVIQSGSLTVNFCTFRENAALFGGAIRMIDSPASRFQLCRFENNYAESWAGAVNVRRSHPSFHQTIFMQNYGYNGAGAVNNDEGSTLFFRDCTFLSNRTGPFGYGGAVVNNDGGRIDAVRSFFVGNEAQYGGGVMNYYHPVFSNESRFVQCTFVANRATESSGALAINGDTDLFNCLIAWNEAKSGAGVYYQQHITDDPRTINIVQSTIVGNRAANYGGGIYHSSTQSLTLNNSLLWWNHAGINEGLETAQIKIWNAVPAIKHSAIQGWSGIWAGIGNAGDDPIFLDPVGNDGEVASGDEDLRLSPDSPYIDAGDNDLVPADVLDVDADGNVVEPHPWEIFNRPRIRDGNADAQVIVDIGAFEYPAGRPGDADFDGDIDLVDWQRNRVCLQGPKAPMLAFARSAFLTGPIGSFGGYPAPGAATPLFALSFFCEPVDMDHDQDVDLRDISQWIDAFGTED